VHVIGHHVPRSFIGTRSDSSRTRELCNYLGLSET
jgi:hypothetical protein